MCIIIAKKAGVEPLDEGYFERAWSHNGDGGGIVWKSPEDECAYVQKGFMKREDMLAKLREVNKKENSFIAHFRIRSVGEVKPENTHPFVMDKVTFAHNGTITSLQPMEGKTDSETFGLAFLKKRSMKWIKENALLLELALGTSKFAIMDNKTGEIFILNQSLGKEQDGAWFSNGSADKPTPTVYNYSNSTYRPYSGNNSNRFLDDDDYDLLEYSGSGCLPIRPRAIFGTKSYIDSQFAEYRKDQGCWVYTSTGKPVTTYPFTNDIVVARNGLWKINVEIEPKDFGFSEKKYKGRAPEYKMISALQRDLQKNLARYWKSRFVSTMERDDYENDLRSENIVLDAARRFIKNGIELTAENLMTFVISCMSFSTYASQAQKQDAQTNIDYVNDYIEQMFIMGN